jgi:hypothetical protein
LQDKLNNWYWSEKILEDYSDGSAMPLKPTTTTVAANSMRSADWQREVELAGVMPLADRHGATMDEAIVV